MKTFALLLIPILGIVGCENDFKPNDPEPIQITETTKPISGIGTFDFKQQSQNNEVTNSVSFINSVSFTNFSGRLFTPFSALITVFTDTDKETIGFRTMISTDSLDDGTSFNSILNDTYKETYTQDLIQIEIISLDANDSLSGWYQAELAFVDSSSMRSVGLISGVIDHQNQFKFRSEDGFSTIDSLAGFLSASGEFDGRYTVGDMSIDITGGDMLQPIASADTLLFTSKIKKDSLYLKLERL